MTRVHSITHAFVDLIPDKLDENTLYISIEHATAVHRCLCGCGHEVVTPLDPTEWSLTFDGKTVSLDPSIGNWSFGCNSHYWIDHNHVFWSGAWSRKRIASARAADARLRELQYGDEAAVETATGSSVGSASRGLRAWLNSAVGRAVDVVPRSRGRQRRRTP